ncbi:hypothetical protein DSL64_08490 [Dyadobacter luteus]|uniref:DUF3857 domain-containing protein n=1 Tax=Dyadobacter luteus TaxID=2259619 RepID=A0A3D8YDN0_9BACT|nr:DUF3857 domain-containing protein [Dyadobacter luteus]REA62298.1 hypothetical protein DSL64_08490 [Dyadobacter luteus]
MKLERIDKRVVSGVLLFLTFLGTTFAYSQQNLAYDQIAPNLIRQAHAVIRINELSWEVISKSEGRLRARRVITILDEKGEEEYVEHYIQYDKFTRISNINGVLYDASGKVVRKLKGSDISDFGYGVSGDEITDARIRKLDFGKKAYTYPYTIEYSYEIRDRNLMFYPRWAPVGNTEVSTELATFSIKTPPGFQFRYKVYHGAAEPQKQKDKDGNDLYIWKVENYAATGLKDPYPMPGLENTPVVLVAPSEFELQEYKGNFNSWEDLSKFYYTLNAGRDVLPAPVQEEIKTLIKSAKSEREKILLIYKWMQARSRYVSIQLGIGGWQTIDATTVSSKGYGDCKALTNFTLAALQVAGIRSHAALIRAGRDEMIKADFPSSQFNHVIACAIAEKDTVWLECTSQTTSANFMGTFTGGRPALLVMPQGGKLVMTPDYTADKNKRTSHTDIRLDKNGDAQILANTRYSGLRQETRNRLIHAENADGQKKWLVGQINLPSLELEAFKLKEEYGEEPYINEQLNIKVRNGAARSGKRLFVKPYLLSRSVNLPDMTERTHHFYLPPSEYSFTDIDTVSYLVPEGFKLESTLPSVDITSKFGSLKCHTSYEQGKMVSSRKIVLTGGTYAATDYTEWISFLRKIRKADRAQVVFIEEVN